MKKISRIILGWYRFLFAKRSRMAKRRLYQCWKCDKRKSFFCGICFCELHAKAEIKDEECPHPLGNKWKGC